MIILFHGSNQEIGEIDLSLGLPDKDFGLGFYLTHLRHQADRMALSKCRRSPGKTPTVTVYESDYYNLLNDLDSRLYLRGSLNNYHYLRRELDSHTPI